MRQTIVVHSRHALRFHREQAARKRLCGLQVLTIEQLSARLAGGFMQPIDQDALKAAIRTASQVELGELDEVKKLPGFQRAAAATLQKAWTAGLDLASLCATASPRVKPRLEALTQLEANVLKVLPLSMQRSADLVARGLTRIEHAKSLFGRIEIHGHTELAPVWRPLLKALVDLIEVIWIAEARHVPTWVPQSNITVIKTPPATPDVAAVSCASPRHEALEAIRWARALIAGGHARPEEIAIAAASPDSWDDHLLALTSMSGIEIHFVHGRKVLTGPEGQTAAALAEVLLRGFSQTRVTRLVSLLRSESLRFQSLPSDWWRALPENAPLLDTTRWRQALSALTPDNFRDGADHGPLLLELVDVLARGLKAADEIGEQLLSGRCLAIWHKALTEGPPEALDVTLSSLRMDDGIAPETSIIWTPASALAAAPRPCAWLLGLTSRSWPRRAGEDPLLPDHIVPAEQLDPLPVHQADRRDFATNLATATRQVVCSRARRDAEGRLSGVSPLYPRDVPERYQQRARIPEHAAGWSDRLFARPAEFAGTPLARSSIACWIDWHTQQQITPHDGLVRANHPVVMRALDRRQSATSLSKLLRDPLGYLWTYGFGWDEPDETEEPLLLEALTFGSLLHAALEGAVTRLEQSRPGGFSTATAAEIVAALDHALVVVADEWGATQPTPPPVIWRRKLAELRDFAFVALTHSEAALPNQRSWAEIPFGGDRRAEAMSEEARKLLPWDPMTPVVIPGTDVHIGGTIDRLDLTSDSTGARVTDYKSGKPPSQKSPPILKQGSELQRCLYAYAVTALVAGRPAVAARLFYPKAGDGGLFDLADPETVLEQLTGHIAETKRLVAAGNTLPGAGAANDYNDLAFALPGGAKESYFEMKAPLIAARLGTLPQLWEMV